MRNNDKVHTKNKILSFWTVVFLETQLSNVVHSKRKEDNCTGTLIYSKQQKQDLIHGCIICKVFVVFTTSLEKLIWENDSKSSIFLQLYKLRIFQSEILILCSSLSRFVSDYPYYRRMFLQFLEFLTRVMTSLVALRQYPYVSCLYLLVVICSNVCNRRGSRVS